MAPLRASGGAVLHDGVALLMLVARSVIEELYPTHD